MTAAAETARFPAVQACFRAVNPMRFAALAADDAEEAQEPKRRKFSGIAASGRVFRHSWWGNFAIDLEGLQIPDGPLPLLRDHDAGKIVGYTDAVEVRDEGLHVEGVVVDALDHGAEVLALAEAGVPWQMSVFVPPGDIEFVPEGTHTTVNGQRLDGPGHIFRTAELREVTVTAVGADANTSLAVFSGGTSERTARRIVRANPRDHAMTDQTESRPADSSADDAAALATAATDAVTAERQRVAAIMQSAAEFRAPQEDVAQAIGDGMDAAAAGRLFSAFARGRAAAEQSAAATAPADAPPASAAPDARTQHADRVRADFAAARDAEEGTAVIERETSEEKLRAKWDASESLRDEFVGSFERFKAFSANRHQIKMLTGAKIA